MTFGSPQPNFGWWVPAAGSPPGGWPSTPPPSSPPLLRLVLLALVVVVSLTLPIGVGVAALVATGKRNGAYHVGDCVMMASSTGGELKATRAECDTDASFTVGTMVDRTGDCAPTGYDHFPPPSADAGTGRLCLVPNLVVGHCYRLGVAVGVWNLADCTSADAAMIRVTDRFDVEDEQVCTSEDQLSVRTYPAPPRTYCLGLV